MASSTISPNYQFGQDREIWENLKKAIAVSSGFKRWQEEQMTSKPMQTDLDEQVRCYLHETLATLAY